MTQAAIAQLTLHHPKQLKFARLDVWPFVIAYVALSVLVVSPSLVGTPTSPSELTQHLATGLSDSDPIDLAAARDNGAGDAESVAGSGSDMDGDSPLAPQSLLTENLVWWLAFGSLLGTAFLHGIVALGSFWSLKFHCFVAYHSTENIEEATVALVIPRKHCGKAAICPLNVEHPLGQEDRKEQITIEFQKIKHMYDAGTREFVPIEFPTNLSLRDYAMSRGLPDEDFVSEASRKYGRNEFDIPLPKFTDLFKENITQPFFVFQIFSVGLWCLDEYWRYAMFTLLLLIMFQAALVMRRMKNLQYIRAMRVSPYRIYAYRGERWTTLMTDELLPGDLVSIVRSKDDDVCPCDLLLMQGSCVMNEALLTGESTPQIKEAIPIFSSTANDILDLERAHKRHLISGGTRVLQSTPPARGAGSSNENEPGEDDVISLGSEDDDDDEGDRSLMATLPKPPDNGAVGFVLKTGFSTNQGKLLRTILFSTEEVSVNNAEAFMFILMLLCFAVAASAYVFIHGLEDEDRSRYKLVLNCIMIITTVVPPELPVVLSLAVNTSLVALAKKKIFCVEGFRLPFAGRISYCCFDKTGTITSDDFEVLGVAGLPKSSEGVSSKATTESLVPMDKLPGSVTTIVAGCHSLVVVDGDTTGDPLELAAVQSVGWTCGKDGLVETKTRGAKALRVMHRFAFSSLLKRMSNIIKNPAGQLVLVSKGASEVMRSRFVEVPSDYDHINEHFSQQGCRVLAMGFKNLKSMDRSQMRHVDRDDMESELHFAGFLVLRCPLKRDSLQTIVDLRRSSHKAVMITGDHALTACAVAAECLIAVKPILTLTYHGDSSEGAFDEEKTRQHPETQQVMLTWNSLSGEVVKPFLPFSRASVNTLAADYDMCITGDALAYLRQSTASHGVTPSDLTFLIPKFKVFARFTPYQKEFVITTLKSQGLVTLMCGDGTNDVGALKQAHVGVALSNAGDPAPAPRKTLRRRPKSLKRPSSAASAAGSSSADAPAADTPAKNPKKAKAKSKRRRQVGVDTPSTDSSTSPSSAGKSAGPNGVAPHRRKKKDFWAEFQRSLDKVQNGASDDEPQPVRLADATIASPFTSKIPEISACLHVIRQGRCTLVTTLQMYLILALNCLITAYSLSVLYLDGVKLGDTQATIQGFFISGMFYFITQSTPLKRLSAERPFTSVFNPHLLISLIGQFAIHLYVLMISVGMAKPLNPTDEETLDPDGDFSPNILNTVVYHVSTIMLTSTFAVNYIGRPFMQSAMENKPFYRTIMATYALVAVCVLDAVPGLNESLELVPLPTWEFQCDFLSLMVVDVISVFAFERVVRWIFSPRPILDESFEKKIKEMNLDQPERPKSKLR